jgi:DNA repair exonuclease SbcCD nuclease subunit
VALFVRSQTHRLKDHGIKVFAIDGNHDMCENNWMHLCDMGKDMEVLATANGFRYHAMDLPMMRIVGFNYMRRTQIRNALQDWTAGGGKADVLVLHQGVFDAAPHIEASELSANEICELTKGTGVGYVALGHYHDFKLFEHKGVSFCYPGSIEKMASNEADGKKVVEMYMSSDGKVGTVLHEVPGRAFEFFGVSVEDDIQKFKDKMNLYQNSPLIYVRYNSEIPDVAARLESAIDSRFMFKLIPDSTIDLGDNLSWTKELAAESLSDIVAASYPASTPEHELITQMLDNPGNVLNIVKAYLTSKGLKVAI